MCMKKRTYKRPISPWSIFKPLKLVKLKLLCIFNIKKKNTRYKVLKLNIEALNFEKVINYINLANSFC